jgi:acyl-CoA dehydrogenase
MDFLDLDLNLNEDDIALKKSAYKFAQEVMRPIAKELDEMTPEEVVAKGSPLYDFYRQAFELGYHTVLIPEAFGGMDLSAKQKAIIFEELSRGSFGLGVALLVTSFHALAPLLFENEELINTYTVPFCKCTDGSIRGCWAITEPNHGSDTLMPHYPTFSDPTIKSDCRARLDGNEWVINGQKAAWVSGAPVATHAVLYCNTDPSRGHASGGIAIVPLDLPGVSKGKPLDKIGQRDLPQGELYFDDVRIPKSHMLVGAENYEDALDGTLCITTAYMGVASTGLARAALDEALTYAKERMQGGKMLNENPAVQAKLFHMFKKVESCRQLSRAVFMHNLESPNPAEEYGVASKVHCTQTCFEVTNDAVQIFGGNGLTKEYLVEKLFRDARATLIEDGSNDTLAVAGGHKMIHNYPRIG